MAKKAAQLDREIDAHLREKSLPKRLKHGDYVATFKGIDERFPGDTLASAHWKITRRGKEVGTMHEGSAYGWGRPTITTRQLTWSGPLPPGTSDPRSSHYGWSFDLGPFDSYKEALARFAKHADRLINWRKKHGKK